MKKNKKSKKNHTVSLFNESYTVSLPQELILEILLRLPVKSVVRFKCVCKSWLSLISSPKFAQLHFDLAAAPSHRFLLRVTGDDTIESIDPEASLSDASAVMYLRLPPLPARHPSNLFFNRTSDRLQVCGSCRGFVLLHEVLLSGHNFIVWNPLTGLHKPIPPGFQVKALYNFLCGFCYDASNDDYLVVYIEFIHVGFGYKHQAMIKLFSLKFNSWDCKYIETKLPYYQHAGFDFIAGSLLNGALHWLVSTDNDNDMVIIAFDLVERSLSEIPLPPVLNTHRYSCCGLKVIGGCLGIWVRDDDNYGRGEMWMMKEYKVLSSWTRSFDLLGDLPLRIFSPICLTKNNTLFGSDLRHQRLHKLCGKTKKWLRGSFAYGKGKVFHPCNLQCSLYRESLLSLPTISGNNPR